MDSGTMLAHYRVADLIGKGGMGEVYRAKDTKLDRDVALKILPPEFSADGDRMTRFGREAKLLASLHHPNIASIFGFESTPECTFLVMELIEGEDLSETLRNGRLPIDEAVDVARQIAEGLEEAHEKGIVHRDLKPANVKRTPDGKVKVLDFGLARVFSGETAGEESISDFATMTAGLTQAGTVLGTAAYMSPEQARGKEVDRRTDIWAFGVILFELLTGKQLFLGETASDTMAGILKSEPEWDLLPDDTPIQVDRVLRRCLAKDPRKRLRDIGEARVRLEDPMAESGMFSGPVSAVNDVQRGEMLGKLLPWGIAVISVFAVVWFLFGADNTSDQGVEHLAVPGPIGAEYHINSSFPGLPMISPDGMRVAFSAVSEEEKIVQLYLRDFNSEHARVLNDTKDAQYPFWSSDSTWIAYYSRDKGLLKIPADGGPAQVIAEAGNGKGGSWNQNDEILFTPAYNSSIFVVSASGGEVRQITDLAADEGFNSHRHPQFMPDGRHFIYFARANGKMQSQIRYASLDGAETKVVTSADLMADYASGLLMQVVNGDLVAQPFDPSTGILSGSLTPVVVDVMTLVGAAKGAFSASANGKLIYLKGEVVNDANLASNIRTGNKAEMISDKAGYNAVTLSPDGRLAAVCVTADQVGTWDIWTVDLQRNFRTRFTVDPADESDIVWSHDSKALYFTSDRDGDVSVYHKAIGSPDKPRIVFSFAGAATSLRLWDISDDGQTVFYSMAPGGTALDLWSADINGETEPRLLRQTSGMDVAAQLSPDEKWLSFCTMESGELQVYVAPWPAMTPITQVSTTTGTWSRWTKGGRELIFQEESGLLSAVSMTLEDGRMNIGNPESLFEVVQPILDATIWAVSADGEKFLTIDSESITSPQFCNLVVNWPLLVTEK